MIKYFCDNCKGELIDIPYKEYKVPLEKFKTNVELRPILHNNHFCSPCEVQVWREVFTCVNKKLEELETE